MRPRKATKEMNGITIPNPPKKATHVLLLVENGKKATVNIKDFDTLLGTKGSFQYIQRDNRGKTIQKWGDLWKWSGEEVVWTTKTSKKSS